MKYIIIIAILFTIGCQTLPLVKQYDVTYSYTAGSETITEENTFIRYQVNNKQFVGVCANGKEITIPFDSFRIIKVEKYIISYIK